MRALLLKLFALEDWRKAYEESLKVRELKEERIRLLERDRNEAREVARELWEALKNSYYGPRPAVWGEMKQYPWLEEMPDGRDEDGTTETEDGEGDTREGGGPHGRAG